MALVSSSARITVEAESKKISSSGLANAASRSVVQRSIPWSRARRESLSSFRPTRMGSGKTRSPFDRTTPPCSRIATIERIRCWFVPIRPVTPCMIIPSRFVAITKPFRRRFTLVTVWLLPQSHMPCNSASWSGNPHHQRVIIGKCRFHKAHIISDIMEGAGPAPAIRLIVG